VLPTSATRHGVTTRKTSTWNINAVKASKLETEFVAKPKGKHNAVAKEESAFRDLCQFGN